MFWGLLGKGSIFIVWAFGDFQGEGSYAVGDFYIWNSHCLGFEGRF